MNRAHKGRRAEHRARRLLEADGYAVVRAAGSKGPADLVAWDAAGVRFISVKCGTARASRQERAALVALRRPANATIELWRFPPRCTAPLIEMLS